MASNKKIFSLKPTKSYDHTTEYPSDQITVKIRLISSNDLDASLKIIVMELRNNNMAVSRSSSGNVITVTGYPPDNAFDRHKVLKIVQRHITGAQFDR